MVWKEKSPRTLLLLDWIVSALSKFVQVLGMKQPSEDQCVVMLDCRDSECFEAISRGRNLLVMVTTRGDG